MKRERGEDEAAAAAYRAALDRFARGIVLKVAKEVFDELAQRRRSLRTDILALDARLLGLQRDTRETRSAIKMAIASGKGSTALAREADRLMKSSAQTKAELVRAREDFALLEALIEQQMLVRSRFVKRTLGEPRKLAQALLRDPELAASYRRYARSKRLKEDSFSEPVSEPEPDAASAARADD
jgi:hypothetical protein